MTTMFEGQRDHLVPALSAALIESDLFVVAGRMIGHSAIHGHIKALRKGLPRYRP